jgi:hypothetical protein
MQHSDETSPITHSKPMQVGQTSGEIDELTERISHSGIANNEADVERIAGPGPRAGEDPDADTTPIPIITSS